MDRALQANIIAKSGKAVELAGDIDVGAPRQNGNDHYRQPERDDISARRRVYRPTTSGGWPPWPRQPTPPPRARASCDLYEQSSSSPVDAAGGQFHPFHRADAHERHRPARRPKDTQRRIGRNSQIRRRATRQSPPELTRSGQQGGVSQGATPLVVADGAKIVGVVVLEDILKPHMSERFERLRRMGLRTVMITGDNPLTAATIAKKAGVDDFLAEATPETKLAYIKKEQMGGKLVAMMGDGTNDAPALAQADVALAMNAGTQAAKEAANMVDLDSDPTKLIEVVEIGKQLLVTRGSLTTFSIANDVAKYFAIIPALFAGTLPWLKAVDIMHLHSPTSAILSAVIFNALIIPALIPVALKGVRYRPLGADALLRRNLFVWGLGGVILPFIGIKLIDVVMTTLHLVS